MYLYSPLAQYHLKIQELQGKGSRLVTDIATEIHRQALGFLLKVHYS